MDTMTPGLPTPLFDEEGFPLPLRGIRKVVQARGGQVRGELHEWTLTHPHRSPIKVSFLIDGDVLIEAGRAAHIRLDVEDAYIPWSRGEERSALEVELVGILDGGLREFRDVDLLGRLVRVGWNLRYPGGQQTSTHYLARIPILPRRRWYPVPRW